ncbi:type II secretion system major pseudopilin GspG [Zhongshania marina]|uniref:type II secretion system major pseudopilin GspG n=1 Tax=Zhongshania marina TaxID=2304603 RepID=UPI001313E934
MTDVLCAKEKSLEKAPSRHRQQGIKRWELLLILAITAAIALAVGSIIYQRLGSAMSEQVNNDFRRLSTALHQYKLDNKRYPSSEQGLAALYIQPQTPPLAPLWKGPYIGRASLTQDPWNNAYLYTSSDSPPGFEITTLGADAKPNGKKMNQDMSIRFRSDENYFD